MSNQSVLKKLQEARIELQSTELKKSGKNKFAGYEYFELGDFLPQIQTIFNNIGLCGIISFGTELATLSITDTESGEFVELTSPMGSAALKGCHEVQNIGACETYSRRYLWMSAMEIVEHDPLDATTGSKAPQKPTNPPPVLKSTHKASNGHTDRPAEDMGAIFNEDPPEPSDLDREIADYTKKEKKTDTSDRVLTEKQIKMIWARLMKAKEDQAQSKADFKELIGALGYDTTAEKYMTTIKRGDMDKILEWIEAYGEV